MMNCLKCGASLDLTQRACPQCGVALDSDGDGVPDVLEALVERKARAIVAEEKAREAAETARREADEAAREAAEERRQAEARAQAAFAELQVRLSETRAEIACEERPVPNWRKLGMLTMVFALIGALPVSVALEHSAVAQARYGLSGWWNLLFNTVASIAVMFVPASIVVAILRRAARRAYLRTLRMRETQLVKMLADAAPSLTTGAPYR